MVIQAELVQCGLLKSDLRLDLGESELPLLPPPTYWLFRTNQMLRLVSWSTKRSISTLPLELANKSTCNSYKNETCISTKTLHHQPIGQCTTSPFSDLLLGSTTVTVLGLLLGIKFQTGKCCLAQPKLNKLLGVKFQTGK